MFVYASRMVDMAVAHPGPSRSSSQRRATSGHPHRATVEDWLRIPEGKRAELIQGRIVYHACPGVKHGSSQGRLNRLLAPYDRRRTGGGGGGGGAGELGGWWLSLEVDMEIGDVGCRPDVVGWRRDKHARVPHPDARGVVTQTPDFLCEVLSASTARYDTGEKRDSYFQAGVPHYWLVDPEIKTLTILEWTPRGYLIVKVAGPGETVRAAPFEGVEIPVDELFLDEEGEVAAPAPPTPAAAPAGAKKRAPRRPR